jgi:hypothetical protein
MGPALPGALGQGAHRAVPRRQHPAAAAISAGTQGAVEAQLIRGTYVSRDLREQTFRVYYDRWVASRQISATRKYTDDIRAAKHVLPYWGSWAICDIRPSDIDDWIALLSSSMGRHSVRHCYGVLRGPLRRAIKDRVIDNPCIDIALPKKPAPGRPSTRCSLRWRSTGWSQPSLTPTPATQR